MRILKFFVVSIRFMGAFVGTKDEDIANAAHEIVAFLCNAGMSWTAASDHVITRLERVIEYVRKNRTP